MKVLLKFFHGLGDCVQFTAVLQHLKKHRPDWKITVLTDPGKHTTFVGLCERATANKDVELEGFDRVQPINWYECHQAYSNIPSSKVERCLQDEFGIQPELKLCLYSQKVRDEANQAACAYLRAIGTEPKKFIIIHYQGNTSTDRKNINHDQAKLICDRLIHHGLVPVILDWDDRSPLIDQKTVFCPDKRHPLWMNVGTGDAERIAALIHLAKFCIGIDSGPGHVAAATNTPTLLFWNKHHPVNYYCPAKNVFHLVPHTHESFLHVKNEICLDFFKKCYRHEVYTNPAKSLIEKVDLMSESTEQVNGYLKSGDFWVRSDNAEQDMVVVRDIYDKNSYRLDIIPGIIERAKFVVDIGAHIGTFAKLMHKLNPNAKIVCVEACPENIECLTKNVGDFAIIIHAACTYEQQELMLLNAVRPNCESTGGSVVVPRPKENSTDLRQVGYQYWADYRPLRKITLEEIMNQFGQSRIDLLKLDCEGAEYSILGETPSIERIGFIVGEYHDKNKWQPLLNERFLGKGWDYGIMCQGPQMGNFHLSNMNYGS